MTEETNVEPKKYAGKFETIEQLEEGYKNSAKVFQENEALKQQLNNFKAPDDYQIPSNVELHNVDDIKVMAKNANLSQAQFEKLVMETHAVAQRQAENHKKKFEDQVKELGEEKLNLLKDYVSKSYPAEVQETVLKKLIIDEKARTGALSHREQTLSNTVPGIGTVQPATYTVTYDDVLKAREDSLKNRGNMRFQDRYIKLTAQYTAQNKK